MSLENPEAFAGCEPAAERLHSYLVAQHWRGDGLYGPDPGIRVNYRVGRFVKSYLSAVAWKDDMFYYQAQGYWVLANWELFRRTGEQSYREMATATSERIVETQTADGCWLYPNPEWEGRVATVEGSWASLAMAATYRRTQDARYSGALLRWHDYLVEKIGFQIMGDEWAINYFAGETPTQRVPNNSAETLRFFAELAGLTGDTRYLEPCRGLIRFLANSQKPTGEFPYTVPGEASDHSRPHFQCFQYNAFMGVGLMEYVELTGDSDVRPIIEGILRFLPQGLTDTGATRYACSVPSRHVTYHSAVLAAAFTRAGQLGFPGFEEYARRAYGYVLSKQQADGGIVYSVGDYRLLSDRRSYPRYLAMILYHLLHPHLEPTPSRIQEDHSRSP